MVDTNAKNKDSDETTDQAKDAASSAETSNESGSKTLTAKKGKGTLSLKGNAATQAKQSLQGRGDVAVEVKKRRGASTKTSEEEEQEQTSEGGSELDSELRQLTSDERQARAEALQKAIEDERLKKEEEERKAKEAPPEKVSETVSETKDEPKTAKAAEQSAPEPEKSARERELEELQRIEQEEQKKQEERRAQQKQKDYESEAEAEVDTDSEAEDTAGLSYRERMRRAAAKKANKKTQDDDRKAGRITVSQALNKDYERSQRAPSLAAQKRAKEKARLAAQQNQEPPKKVTREVTLPEHITVQELANRMAARSADVVKELMKMGVMATVNEVIEADTAELVIEEFGHKVNRVTEADVEIGLEDLEEKDDGKNLQPRPPVVTVMGHVDHGKTSLLDALRKTDVVAGEAGGITQHIGAYQIRLSSEDKITFVDTPGHAAFTEMRARGADVTDIVVLVVAANDSIMPQTIEAINHAKAAEKPIIIAINKVDLPDADPEKVKQDLLSHEIVVEDFSGDIQAVEVSALQGQGLDTLEEAIMLQAEILELKANPQTSARGAVIETKQEKGRGSVATILVQKGTLKVGDIFVAGSEWGRVRALVDDKGEQVDEAIPAQPVEVLGLNGTPNSGDVFIVVGDETKAKEVSEYRKRKLRESQAALVAGTRSSFDAMLAKAHEDEKEGLPVVIKSDVHGSLEALTTSLEKLNEDNEEVNIRILHAGVGGITESDVQLAKASNGLVIGFNVRANAQAREMAMRENVNIQYYNIIYNVIDDVKGLVTGMLSPVIREEYIGQAEIREVFNITKVGKIAGCMVTRGEVRRGNKVRLLRNDVVIHEGTLKTLKRFKDEVKEVKEGMECGMAFEKYEDIKEGDIIECYEITQEARELNS